MTWFLNDAAPSAPEPIEGPIPTRGQQFRGSAKDLWLLQNTWNQDQGYRNDLFDEMVQSLGGLEHFMPRTRDEVIEYKNPERRGQYLARRIGELKKSDAQGTLAHLPGSPEEFEAEWKSRRQKDLDENRAMLDRGDSTVAKALGGLAGQIADPINIALAPFGGSLATGAGRFILAEAALGAVSEIPGALAEQQRAPELGVEPENPLVRIGMGAATSGALAGVMVGGARVLTYSRTRTAGEAAARPADVSGRDYADAVHGAEADLRAGREPGAAPPPSVDANGIPEGYYASIRSAESGGDDAAKNPLSSATGRYQFTSGTWSDVARRHPELGLTPDGRLDPAQQERAIRALTADNADGLRDAGVGIDSGNLYAAHFLGVGDARRVLRAGADTQLTDLLSPEVISANPFLKRMSVADFRAWTLRKTASTGGAGVDGDFTPAPGGGAFVPTGRSFSEFAEVTTPAGMAVEVRYRVVDMADLKRATGDLQPRDRSRAASDEQIADIARNLDAARLMPSPEGDRGAPIVGNDMVVESGNGRVGALGRAAEQHPERYQAYVRAIEEAGFEIPEGVSRPVLVGERTTELDQPGRRRFVRENNTSSIGRMSATEQARVDADYMTRAAFDHYRAGRGLNSVDNAEFVRRVFAAMPQAERAGLMTAAGRLNIDGLRRLRQALFARAFEADDLLTLLAETEHQAVENLLRMLEDLAPDWAAFRDAVEAGYIRPEFDITDQLMDAVRMIAKARIEPRDGQSVIAALRDRLNQGDMLHSRDKDLSEALIATFYKGDRARSHDASAQILNRYMSEAEIAGRADIEDMLGAEAGITPTAALRQAVAAQDARAPMPVRDDAPPEALDGAAGGQPDIRALDSLDTAEGAHSPALVRATDAELREMREAESAGPPATPATAPTPPADAVAMNRAASNFTEARAAAKAFQGKNLTNAETGIVAVVSRNALDKMLSGKAVNQSSNAKLHSRAVANLDAIFSGAVWGWSKPDSKGAAGLTAIHRLFSPVHMDDGRIGMAKITVKETARDNQSNVLYTVEAVDLLEEPSAAKWVVSGAEHDGIDAKTIRSAEGLTNMARSVDDFNTARDTITAARAALDVDPELTLRMGAGQDAREISLADLLDDLDQDDALVRSMTSCSLKGTPQ